MDKSWKAKEWGVCPYCGQVPELTFVVSSHLFGDDMFIVAESCAHCHVTGGNACALPLDDAAFHGDPADKLARWVNSVLGGGKHASRFGTAL